MTDIPPQPAASASDSSSQLEAVAQKFGGPIRFTILAVAAILALVPIVLLVLQQRGVALPGSFWYWAILGCAAAGVAVFQEVYRASSEASGGEQLRLVLLLLGFAVGFPTVLLGLALPFTVYATVFGGSIAEWRASPQALGWTALSLLGGMLLMFVTLGLARGQTRVNPSLRVLLYGYNAVFSSVLLICILLVLNLLTYVNVWPFTLMARTADWTTSGLYTLSDSTKNVLAALDKPVKVYAIQRGGDPISKDVETLLESCREINRKFEWESMSRDYNRGEIIKLAEQYQLTDPVGLLIVYGPTGDQSSDFIKQRDLYTDQSSRDTARYTFKGESALLKSLTYLTQGKSKSAIYFTQGHGEPDLNERGVEEIDVGLGQLRDQLSKGNYDVKELKFARGEAKVPDDADVVVVARPKSELKADEVRALREYYEGAREKKKKGKLFILLDVVTTPDGQMARSGLEDFLLQAGIRVGNDRVIEVNDSPYTQIAALTNPEGDNPIARQFFPRNARVAYQFFLDDVRTVTPLPSDQRGGPAAKAETLLITSPDQYLWAETDLKADAKALAVDFRKNLANNRQLLNKLSPNPLSLAVAVTEGGGMPNIPGHEMARESHPRMVVFGDTTWITNRVLAEKSGTNNYSLFTSCLAWLRERPDIGVQVNDKNRAEFRLDVPPDDKFRLMWMPVALILLCVMAMGIGVWVVRRR